MSHKKNDPLRLDISYLVKGSPGTHKEFDFNFPQLAFSPELTLVDIHGVIAVSTTDDGVVVDVKMTGLTQLSCSRCLDDYWQPIKINFTEMFSSNRLEKGTETLGVQPLPADGSIDLTPILRDYTSLDIPIRQVCREECKGFCPICGLNLNEGDCGHRQESIDPRMEGLKALLDQEKKD